MTLTGKLVDLAGHRIYPAEILIDHGRIQTVRELSSGEPFTAQYICPGFIDAHVHIESSMLIPSEFARLAVVHGTVCTVSDPHEIANVLGLAGVDFMLKNALTTPFYFYFGAPSCVPATVFETAGAELDPAAVDQLLSRSEIRYLSEMMNFPGVLAADPDVMKKIASAKKYGKPVDGHAPGLRGEEAGKYIAAGISTDHECFTEDEALDKLSRGMKILIREGSAARNFDALAGLLETHWEKMMFCSDDKHPDSLVKSHINELCARAVARGIDPLKVLTAACLNPVLHYGLAPGLLRAGDPADFILLRDLKKFEIIQTWIKGEVVAADGHSLLKSTSASSVPNRFSRSPTLPGDFAFPAFPEKNSPYPYPVIGALDGQLITSKLSVEIKPDNGFWHADPARDILKIVVVNRYHDAPVARAFIKNFGLTYGALASSVAHDSHNIVAVGTNDEALADAVNAVIEQKGGISLSGQGMRMVLNLPVAGLMSSEDGYRVAETYTAMDQMAKQLGSGLRAPLMTLSFMALLVIPHLKLSDRGLFDGDRFGLL